MYLRHFGLTQEPFSIAPDPRFLFMSERHREALAHLRFGLQSGGGFVVLTGEIGAGKTTVCRCILEQIPQQCNIAYLFNPKLSTRELLQAVCADFGIEPAIDPTQPSSTKRHVDALNAFLLKAHAAGQHNVLIIDEAQRLSLALLEQLRLLTNLETNERKLLQIVLIGQPELRQMLARPELEQLTQRVVARFHLGTLSAIETDHYVRHRLAVAGLAGEVPFDAAALRQIHRRSRGVPRRINLLCDRALLGAYSQGRTRVDKAIVNQAALEVFGKDRPSRRPDWEPWRWLLIGAGATAALAAGALLAWSALRDRPVASSAPAASVQPVPNSASSVASAASSPSLSPSRPAQSEPAPLATANAAAPSTVVQGAARPAILSSSELTEQLKLAAVDERLAWRQLAATWNHTPTLGDACSELRTQGLHCFKRKGDLALLRAIDRPAILPLYADASEPRYVILQGLSATAATIRVGDQLVTVSLADLAARWRDEFGVLWRVPSQARLNAAGQLTAVDPDWLAAQLAHTRQAASGANTLPDTTPLKDRVQAFQRATGLTADGQVGAVTLMMLGRVRGAADGGAPPEPRLHD